VITDPAEYIGEPSLGIDVVELGCLDQGWCRLPIATGGKHGDSRYRMATHHSLTNFSADPLKKAARVKERAALGGRTVGIRLQVS
jgi:hypothetical protein